MKADVDRMIADFMSRFRIPSARDSAPGTRRVNDLHRGQRCPEVPEHRLPAALDGCTDVRHQSATEPALDYRRLYRVEPTTWGLDGGFNPPLSSPTTPPDPSRSRPPVPEPGAHDLASPRTVHRHSPRPFQLFDEALR